MLPVQHQTAERQSEQLPGKYIVRTLKSQIFFSRGGGEQSSAKRTVNVGLFIRWTQT